LNNLFFVKFVTNRVICSLMVKFTVLIAVYEKENPDFLKLALESIWFQQTLKPSEIVLVCDGPLTRELDKVINVFKLNAPLKVLKLEKNYGLGNALSKGLYICSNELVIRMDSDDISAPDRFEKQLKYMTEHPEIDISGTNIAEFKESIHKICSHRRLPSQPDELLRFAKTRNPLNHMTVIFHKTSIINAGNYQPFHGYEDYYLWIRMLQNGSLIGNIPENLVFARIGNNMHSRRRGVKLFNQELKLLRELVRIRFLTNREYYKNLLFRAFPRLLPVWGIRIVYKILHR
jgi:glycosyltransferase involved in cell wall biosynthesis